jgi:hypothetical protein
MMKTRNCIVFCVLLFVLLGYNAALASIFSPVSTADAHYLKSIQIAVSNQDKNWLWQQIWRPLHIYADKTCLVIKTEQQFVDHYDDIFNIYVRTSIESAAPQTLLKNSIGLMVGDGAVWFTRFTEAVNMGGNYRIITINNRSPKDRESQNLPPCHYPALEITAKN